MSRIRQRQIGGAAEIARVFTSTRFPSRYTLSAVLVLLVVAALGLASLAQPVDADQALYLVYGKMLANGATLYRDMWDLKQPGIFFFYALAERLFGYDESSAHALELACMLGLSIALQVTTRKYVRPALSALSPLPTVGLYYAVAGPHLASVEGLVNVPLFGVVMSAFVGVRRQTSIVPLFFVSGLAAGCVAVFKLVYVVIPVVVWAIALYSARRSGLSLRRTLTAAFGACAGTIIPIATVVTCLAPAAGLALLYSTTFTDPVLVVKLQHNAPLSRLVATFRWFGTYFAACLVLGGVPMVALLRGRSHLLTRMLGGWLGAGVCAIVVQRWSWWEHHPFLLVAPVGLLALKGLDELWTLAARSRRDLLLATALCAVAAILLLRPVLHVLKAASTLAAYHFALSADARTAYRLHTSADYREAYDNTRLFRDSRKPPLPGPIFVCGSAIEYLFAGRVQALTTDGYSPEYLIDEQWRQFESQLGARLPAYVFVDRDCARLIARNAPAAHALIARQYRPANGSWFERRAPLSANEPEQAASAATYARNGLLACRTAAGASVGRSRAESCG